MGRVEHAEPALSRLAARIESTVLLIIDMQNDYCNRNGRCAQLGLHLDLCEDVITKIQLIATAARRQKIPVIYLVMTSWPQLPEPDAWLEKRRQSGLVGICEEGSWGQAVVGPLTPESGDIVIKKPRFSGFIRTSLDWILRAYSGETIVFTGVTTNGCVDATLRDAFQLGYRVVAASDGVSAYERSLHETSLSNWRRRYGEIVCADDLLVAWA